MKPEDLNLIQKLDSQYQAKAAKYSSLAPSSSFRLVTSRIKNSAPLYLATGFLWLTFVFSFWSSLINLVIIFYLAPSSPILVSVHIISKLPLSLFLTIIWPMISWNTSSSPSTCVIKNSRFLFSLKQTFDPMSRSFMNIAESDFPLVGY